MSCLGKLGRFGNQMFQYAFLRICAEKSGSRIECPFWIGQTLFGHKDAPISQQLPPAIERWDAIESLFDSIPELIPYLEKIAEAKSSRVGSEALEHGLANVDLWGFFQFHTRLIAHYKEYFRTLFQPVMELKSPLEDSLNIQSILNVWGLRTYLGYQIQEIIGVFKSFLYTLGLRFIWK
jgi:hypothetical protein